jgi:hypothetical protein
MEPGFLLRYPGSDSVQSVCVGDLVCALAFLDERVSANSAMYDSGQIFQC